MSALDLPHQGLTEFPERACTGGFATIDLEVSGACVVRVPLRKRSLVLQVQLWCVHPVPVCLEMVGTLDVHWCHPEPPRGYSLPSREYVLTFSVVVGY
jgi:hypothetical protein